jgi:hypothetical protein
MPVKFVITTLKPGVRPEDYERWVRERDYAYTERNPNFISYRVHRIEGPIAMQEYVANISHRRGGSPWGCRTRALEQRAGIVATSPILGRWAFHIYRSLP